MWVLLEDEGESRASATALLKITVPQEKPLQRRKNNTVQRREWSGWSVRLCYMYEDGRRFPWHKDEERKQRRSEEERGKEDEREKGEWSGLLLLTCLASVFVMRECLPLLSLRREEVGCRVL